MLNKSRSEAAEEAAARKAEGDKLKAERDTLLQKLNALRVESASIASAQAADEANAQRMREEKAALMRKVDETRAAVAETEQRIEQLKREEEKAALTEEEQGAV